jgi:hypothetical protein
VKVKSVVFANAGRKSKRRVVGVRVAKSGLGMVKEVLAVKETNSPFDIRFG